MPFLRKKRLPLPPADDPLPSWRLRPRDPSHLRRAWTAHCELSPEHDSLPREGCTACGAFDMALKIIARKPGLVFGQVLKEVEG
jgi:hypothetical protein